tara:strand:+ start:685 stop:858 length:174 start_codon:yes stop_codon:yes gene_type:complete
VSAQGKPVGSKPDVIELRDLFLLIFRIYGIQWPMSDHRQRWFVHDMGTKTSTGSGAG